MKRYLLFDSGCATCSKIADEVERETAGWLKARSLRETAVQEILNKERPGWQWRPMLLELDNEKMRLYAGVSMGLRLVTKLGIRRALRLAQVVVRAHQRSVVPDPTRRQFMRQTGLGLGALALLLGWPTHKLFAQETENDVQTISHQQPHYQGPPGEFYEGFLLLPEADAPAPAFIERPEPLTQHTGASKTLVFDSLEALAEYVPFPLYVLSLLPEGSQFFRGDVIESVRTGQIYIVYVLYGEYNSDVGTWDLAVSLLAERERCRPYPVWPTRILVGEDIIVVPQEKVDSTPQPGVLVTSSAGYKFHWIQGELAYTFFTEKPMDRAAAEQLVRSVVVM